jgi:hypothetical protein
MRMRRLAVVTTIAMTVTATPVLADGDGGQPGRAYGRYCQGQSKKHVPGMRGTPFSACVRAMAQLNRGTQTDPRVACKDMSKRHVAGQRGTPFSRCVSAGATLLEDKAKDSDGRHSEAEGHGRPHT